MSELLAELQGEKCRCGRRKRAKQTFCSSCYFCLPKDLQSAIYRRFGEGYEEAYAAAAAYLEGDTAPDGEAA